MKYVRTNRDEKRFYSLMGWFFGSRLVAKELGMRIWDDPNREWIVVLDDEKPIACASIEFMKTGDKAAMKSGWVHPDYRGQGIYDKMFSMRMDIAKERGVQVLTATITEKSRNTHFRYGFRKVGNRGRYELMKKEMDEDV